ncbi:MAG: hypothetical protein ABW000_00080 [Actinoplanes sp.]
MPDASSSPPPLVTIKDGAVILSGEAGNASDTDDYTKQDWKWIEAVLTGASAVNNKNGVATAAQGGEGMVSPESLRAAGAIFNTTQSVMRGVAQNLAAQAKGLAGEGRAWQGKGAEAFLGKMLDISHYLERQAERINGGTNGTGAATVPNQLNHAGDVLKWAQDQVRYIDGFYSNWAADKVTDHGDGVVHVSEIKGLPDVMTAAMRKVMDQLVGEYVDLGVKAVTTPQPVNGGNGSPQPSPSSSPLPSSTPHPSPSSSPLPSNSPQPTPSPSSSPLPSNSPQPTPSPSSSPLPSNSPQPTPSSSPPPKVQTDVPPPAGTATDGPPPSTTADGPPPATTTDGPPPVDTEVPPPAGTAGDGPPPELAGGNAPPGAGNNQMRSFDAPPELDTAPPPTDSGPPNVDGSSNTGQPTPTPPLLPGATPPGQGSGNNQRSLTPPALDDATAPGDNDDRNISPLTPVDAPGGAGGGTGGGGGGTELPPAPDGGNSSTDRDFVPPPITDLDSPPANAPGGSGLGGSPPMMPPMSPPQSGTGATDRPDSSGLVGGAPDDWSIPESPGVPDAPGGAAPGGAAPGGAGGGASGGGGGADLTPPRLPGSDVPGVTTPGGTDTGTGPGGSSLGGSPPMMPPMSPPQSGTGATDRPDSSGLVGGDPADWEFGLEPNAPEAPAGAAPSEAAASTTAPLPVVPAPLSGVPPLGTSRGRERDGLEEKGPELTAESDRDDHDDELIVPLLLPPIPVGRRPRAERSEAGELLSEEDGFWDGTAAPEGTAGHGDLPPDYVGLVRDADDDFGSWDADPLPWVADPAPAEDDDPSSWGTPEPVPEAAVAPEPELEEQPKPRARPTGRSYEAALLAELPRLRAGGPDLTPEQVNKLEAERAERLRRKRIEAGLEKDDDEDDDKEPVERRAADLLSRDDSQWSRSDDNTTGGVIG